MASWVVFAIVVKFTMLNSLSPPHTPCLHQKQIGDLSLYSGADFRAGGEVEVGGYQWRKAVNS